VLPMCLELSVTYVSGSYPPIKGEGIIVMRHPEASYSEAVRISPTKSVIARNEVTWQSLMLNLYYFLSLYKGKLRRIQ